MRNFFVMIILLFVFTACEDKKTAVIPSGKTFVVGVLASKAYASDTERFGVLKVLESSDAYLDNGDRLHLKLVAVDDQAIDEFNDLVQTPDLVAVISFLGSEEMLKLKNTIERVRIPVIAAVATHSKINEISYVSRICLNNRLEANVAAAYLRDELFVPEVAVISDSTDAFSQELSTLFIQRYKQLGGDIQLSLDSTELNDEKVFISKLRDQKVENLYITIDAQKTKLLLDQLHKADLKIKVLVYAGLMSNYLAQYPDDAQMLNGVFVIDNYADNLKISPKAAVIAKEFSKGGLRADSFDALSYDAWMLIKKGLNTCAEVVKQEVCLNQYMRNTDSFEGVSDNISMHEGNADRPVYVNEIQGLKMNMKVKVY